MQYEIVQLFEFLLTHETIEVKKRAYFIIWKLKFVKSKNLEKPEKKNSNFFFLYMRFYVDWNKFYNKNASLVFGEGEGNIVARVERGYFPVVPFCRGGEGDNTFNGFVMSSANWVLLNLTKSRS